MHELATPTDQSECTNLVIQHGNSYVGGTFYVMVGMVLCACRARRIKEREEERGMVAVDIV